MAMAFASFSDAQERHAASLRHDAAIASTALETGWGDMRSWLDQVTARVEQVETAAWTPAAAAQPVRAPPPPPGLPVLRAKDFDTVDRFNGVVAAYPDWADRMVAKLLRCLPDLEGLLGWAGQQATTITRADEELQGGAGVDAVRLSGEVFDVMTERTGPTLYDKRRNCGVGRGLEFWRVLRRDFCTSPPRRGWPSCAATRRRRPAPGWPTWARRWTSGSRWGVSCPTCPPNSGSSG